MKPPDDEYVMPGSVLVHPDHRVDDPGACRIIARATTLPKEWAWVRFTGDPQEAPRQGQDLRGWQRQSLASVGAVLGR